MQQHTVPQDITGFQFKLIGFLTIKQFGYLAAAGVFSFIFFIAPLPGFLKIVTITPFALIGLALAFVPINGIPFDKWIVVFFKSVYSPSRRIWHKEPKELSFLSPAFSNYLKRPRAPQTPRVSDRNRLDEYVASLRQKEKVPPLEAEERRRLSKLDFAATVPHFTDLEDRSGGKGV